MNFINKWTAYHADAAWICSIGCLSVICNTLHVLQTYHILSIVSHILWYPSVFTHIKPLAQIKWQVSLVRVISSAILNCYFMHSLFYLLCWLISGGSTSTSLCQLYTFTHKWLRLSTVLLKNTYLCILTLPECDHSQLCIKKIHKITRCVSKTFKLYVSHHLEHIQPLISRASQMPLCTAVVFYLYSYLAASCLYCLKPAKERQGNTIITFHNPGFNSTSELAEYIWVTTVLETWAYPDTL